MVVIAACAALLAAGVLLALRPPRKADDAAPEPTLRRVVAAALGAGVVAGVLVAGAGGRLVMRLLALTSSEVEGSFTEAGETVGDISFDGTLGLMLFGGVPAGLLSGLLYALVRPALPPGRVGGLAVGAMLLVLAATRIDPMRPDNVDFGLLGPPWLAVLAFTALALLQGMLVVALAERWAPRTGDTPRRRVTATRIAAGALVLVALPGFVGALADILDRG
jgi:hypothetical protein